MDNLKSLEEIYKNEKVAKIYTRMLAVRMVRTCGMSKSKVAMVLGITYKTVSK